MSTRTHKFGRQGQATYDDDSDDGGGGGASGYAAWAAGKLQLSGVRDSGGQRRKKNSRKVQRLFIFSISTSNDSKSIM